MTQTTWRSLPSAAIRIPPRISAFFVKFVDTDGDTLRELTLTIEVRSGAPFCRSGNDLVASVDGISYRLEGSLDLVSFDSAVLAVNPHLEMARRARPSSS
jgi:hypothetical protein